MTRLPAVSRRQMLRASGALLALPFFETMFPARVAKGAMIRPPVRLGIVTVTGGTVIESWKPAEAGPLGKLPSILRSLEPLKDDLVMVSNLGHCGRGDNVNGHQHCSYSHLTAAPLVRSIGNQAIAGISVDQYAAQHIGQQTLLPSLEIGLAGWEQRYSFRSAEVGVPFEANPRLLFERMFRGRSPVAPNWQRRATVGGAASSDAQLSADSLDRSVLDLVLDQAGDLRRGLGRGDQQKLDQYLDSVRAVEKRLAMVEARQKEDVLDLASAGNARLSAPDALPKSGVPIWEITRPINQDPAKHADYIRLLADMMVLAFQTDTTRVVTLAIGSDESLFPGVVTVGYERHCHTLEHQGNDGRGADYADPIAREACRQIHAWYTELFAEMAQKMKAIDEGGSSLLDNSLILYTSYMADGGHGRQDYPAVLVGGAGGKLHGGRHVALEKKAPVANLYVEMLNLVGAPATSFGDSHTSELAGDLNGRLPGLV